MVWWGEENENLGKHKMRLRHFELTHSGFNMCSRHLQSGVCFMDNSLSLATWKQMLGNKTPSFNWVFQNGSCNIFLIYKSWHFSCMWWHLNGMAVNLTGNYMTPNRIFIVKWITLLPSYEPSKLYVKCVMKSLVYCLNQKICLHQLFCNLPISMVPGECDMLVMG